MLIAWQLAWLEANSCSCKYDVEAVAKFVTVFKSYTFPARTTRHIQLAGNVISTSVARNIIRNFCHQATTSTEKIKRVSILKRGGGWLLVKAIFTLRITVMDLFFSLVINQLDVQNFYFIISLFHASASFEHNVLIIRMSKLYYTAFGIITLKQVSGPKLLNFSNFRPLTCFSVMIPEAV